MCFQTSSIRPYQKWNWNGSEIVYGTDIPTTRKLKKGNKIIHKFPVDVREFITIQNNAVIKKVINKIIDSLSDEDKVRFYKNEQDNFDYRVFKCQEYMSNIQYLNSNTRYDQWQFPEETLELGSGDCEDLAFLLASLILASGISDYCVRVAFGRVIDHTSKKKKNYWEHTWVMYQNEAGVWQIIEPLLFTKQEAVKATAIIKDSKPFNPTDVEYLPHYVFNRNHLWRVRTCDRVAGNEFKEYLVSEREYFNKFDPTFAAGVHNTIYHNALKGMRWVDLQKVIAVSLYIDVNTLAYDPRDHFDFAYINESWTRVNNRLASGNLTDFALAVHAIGDFYSHSYHGYFTIDAQGNIPVYDPLKPIDPKILNYNFSRLGNLPGCKLNKCRPGIEKPEDLWNGKLISGQWWRWYASIPNDIQHKEEFCTRRCLPDHDAVAVDSQKFDKDKHKLFTGTEYERQYTARVKAATDHITMVYKQWHKK